MERSSATNNNFRSRSSALNDEQSRRLANAGIMLRLLEIQLRDELDSLQNGMRIETFVIVLLCYRVVMIALSII